MEACSGITASSEMRSCFAIAAVLVWACSIGAQTFDAASVKPSRQTLGRDANSQVMFGPAGLNGRNVTLKRLIAEAYNVRPHQISGGPGWLSDIEYDIDAKADGPTTKESLRLMLQGLLAERFRLAIHREEKELAVYELVLDKDGPKIHPAAGTEVTGSRGFHGTMQQFAEL